MKKRVLSIFIILSLLISITYPAGVVRGADIPAQPAPERLAITALYPNVQPPIGYNGTDSFYADIGWGTVGDPQGISITGKYVNIYLEESAKGYRAARAPYLKERDLPADKPVRLKDLRSGTVYKANARAYYEYLNVADNRLKSGESANSNTIRFLTDINVQCLTMGTNKIKIIWDDVWNNGSRINYKLYVSENREFANTLPIYITQDQISENGPVVVNQADGTLEYVHSVKEPGRVYYIKIVPDISDPEIIKNAESQIILASTHILVRTTKMSTSDAGTIWRLDWSPVVTGISTTGIKVQYQVDKFVEDVPIPMLLEDSTTTFITVPENEKLSYYMIRAIVTKDGEPYYPDSVRIVSDKILLKEGNIPSTPSMPEIVPDFVDSSGALVISYEDILNADGSLEFKGELGKDTATVLWRAPQKADGTLDTDILYDIWLIEDPSKIDSPPVANIVKTSFTPTEANFVRDARDNNNVIGYKYKLDGLLPNHTYYFKVVAKKVFPEEVDGVIQSVERTSQPALKVVITLSGGAIDQPLIPSNPPLKIRESAPKQKMITDHSVTIQLKNRWYEEFYPVEGQWKYIKADKDTLGDSVDYNPTDPATPVDGKNYRKVQYDEGVTLYVGCEEYYEGIDITAISNYKLEKIPTTANDSTENPLLNAPENMPDASNPPVYKKHNVVIPVEQLKPNTTYILWVRAVRDGNPALFSEVSDPIIFTTLPLPSQVVEKPVVPNFTYSYAGDTYVDLGWDYKEGNTYYIKYGTVDDPAKAGNTLTVTSSQIRESGVNFVRIPGLTPDTQYYFWIQAEAFSEDRSISATSDWSDSLLLRTLKDIPPSTPRGFGVKNTRDAVTKNSITFEWIQEEGMEYILEIASEVDYHDAKTYNAGSVSEFKVDGLKSNFRYFARLYAYDPVKKLTSIPTQSIDVRTARSSDDYDSDQDVDNVISGEFIEKGAVVINGIWTVKITGVNADRLIELMSTDKKLDYIVDVSKPPQTAKNIHIIISRSVFDRLEKLKENIAFKTAGFTYHLKAGIFSGVSGTATGKEQVYLFDLGLAPQKPSAAANEIAIRQPLGQMEVTLDTGAEKRTILSFGKPLVISYPYVQPLDYTEGRTYGHVFDAKAGKWERQNTTGQYDSDNKAGIISFSSNVPGVYALADRTTNLFDDIYGHVYERSILNVAYAHKLKSVTGRLFNPDKNAAVGDAVKLLLDTLDYDYDSGYMTLAVKSGFIKAEKLSGDICTLQEAASMAAVLYEKKSKMRAVAVADMIKSYSDYQKIDKGLLDKVAFAVENGFVPNAGAAVLNPTRPVTRGELMYMIEKALALAGELE